MLLDLNLAKKWLRLEEEDTEEDDILGLLIDNAEIYVKKAVGKHYNATEENRKQSQKIALVLVTNWYDNRDLSGQADEKVRYTIKSMVLQLQLSEETVCTRGKGTKEWMLCWLALAALCKDITLRTAENLK